MVQHFPENFKPVLETDFQIFLFENNFKTVFPEIFCLLASVFLLIYGVLYARMTQATAEALKRNSRVLPPIMINNVSLLVILTFLLTFILMFNNPIMHAAIFYNTLVCDDLTFFCKILIICTAILSVCISLDYVRKQALNAFEYIILLLLATSSMLFLISSADMISMYMAIEFQSLCFYVLAAFKRNSAFSTEAGLKYFVLGAFSSGVLLFGCSLIYGFTGITHFSELTKIFSCTSGNQHFTGALIGMIFVAVGFLFKITAVPFHTWAPDVYEGSPTSVTAFFAITPKIAILCLFVRLFESSFYDLNSLLSEAAQLGTINVQSVFTTLNKLSVIELTSTLPWQKIFIFCSIASMIVGALGAMNQKKLKRLLAYSSIGHVGYLLIGLCCGTVEGIQALLINLIIYLIMTINIFAIILSPVRRDFVYSVQSIKFIADLSVLFKTNPILAITLAINLFSMAGLPPLAGFWGKYYLLFSAFSCELYLVAIIGGLATVLSCVYYIRLVHISYFEKTQNRLIFERVPKIHGWILAITLFFIMFLFVFPEMLFLSTHKAALTLSL